MIRVQSAFKVSAAGMDRPKHASTAYFFIENPDGHFGFLPVIVFRSLPRIQVIDFLVVAFLASVFGTELLFDWSGVRWIREKKSSFQPYAEIFHRYEVDGASRVTTQGWRGVAVGHCGFISHPSGFLKSIHRPLDKT